MVRNSYADVLRKEGIKQGVLISRREILVMQLTAKFGEIPDTVRNSIKNTTDSAQLETWILNLVWSECLDDVGITTRP